MNIIVTSNSITYDDFLKVSNLKEANDIVGSINVFVYHKSSESVDDKVRYLSCLKDKVRTLIYVRNKEKVEQAVRMIITGSGGRYVDDEFFLENSSELQNLVNDMGTVTSLVEIGGTRVLGDFLNRYLSDGNQNMSRGYLAIVKDAVGDIVREYKKKDQELIQLSETATELFSHTSQIIDNIREEETALKEALEEVQKAKDAIISDVSRTSAKPSSSVFFFPLVTYMKDKDIIRIKSIGFVPYLVSFAMGMRIYLENIVNVRPKLIVIVPVGYIYEKKYEDYPFICNRNQKDGKNYYNDIVFVNYPNKDVLVKLLEDSDYDTFIILDLTKNDKAHILNSRGSVKYAVSSEGTISRFNLKASSCISSLGSIKNTIFNIPTIENYPKDKSKRERLYLSQCQDLYKILYSTYR